MFALRQRSLLAFLTALFALVALVGRAAGQDLEIHVIDVDQGSCIYVQGPNGTRVLLDGGAPGFGPTITSYLTSIGVTDLGASWPGRVAWHDACHGLRELGIRDEPRRLLAAVAGLELVESATCDRCCGFGGTFSVDLPGVSTGMADDKIDELETLGIDAVVSGDASCLMQLEGRLEARGSRIRAVHLAEILAARDVRRSTPLGASS